LKLISGDEKSFLKMDIKYISDIFVYLKDLFGLKLPETKKVKAFNVKQKLEMNRFWKWLLQAIYFEQHPIALASNSTKKIHTDKRKKISDKKDKGTSIVQ
jgi:hypothetical protein